MIRSGPSAAFLCILYVFMAASAILLPLLPLELTADARATPDLLAALTAAWVLRRPDSVPVFVIVPIFLIADFMLGRPPGLWTLLMLAATEMLRLMASGQDDRPFLIEWLNFGIMLALLLALMTLILNLSFAPHPPLGRVFELFTGTMLAYPALVFVLYALLRVRAPQAAARSARLGRVG
ncbi:MAG: rod shape-determining protein MreD [Pseudomonadota bacterium]